VAGLPISTPVALRILPLGNSITFGYLSTDGNGYRQDLVNMLAGTPVQYIGSVRSGDMADNYNEGHPGAIITQIANYSLLSLPQRPNLILLMAGTNDMNNPPYPATAPQRLGSLIDLCHSTCPDATILVAQLTPAANADVEARIQAFNRAVPGVVDARAKNGTKVLAVDMSRYVSAANLTDGLHPNDYGYNQMAVAWHGGIQDAAKKGWIVPPILMAGEISG
jgi:lysophospholipase L1-like esterase